MRLHSFGRCFLFNLCKVTVHLISFSQARAAMRVAEVVLKCEIFFFFFAGLLPPFCSLFSCPFTPLFFFFVLRFMPIVSYAEYLSICVRLTYLLCIFLFLTCDCGAASVWNLACAHVCLGARAVFVFSSAFLRCLFVCNITCFFFFFVPVKDLHR